MMQKTKKFIEVGSSFELSEKDLETIEELFDYWACEKLGKIQEDELLWCLHCGKSNPGKAWIRSRMCPTDGCDGGWRDCSRSPWTG